MFNLIYAHSLYPYCFLEKKWLKCQVSDNSISFSTFSSQVFSVHLVWVLDIATVSLQWLTVIVTVTITPTPHPIPTPHTPTTVYIFAIKFARKRCESNIPINNQFLYNPRILFRREMKVKDFKKKFWICIITKLES